MSKENGRRFLIYKIDTPNVAIPLGTTASLSISNGVIDATDKDSGGWRELLDGLREWNASMTANYDQAQAEQLGLVDKIIDTTTTTQMAIGIGFDNNTGDIMFTGNALVAETTLTGDNDAVVTVDYTFEGTGALTKVTKA